MKALLWIRFRYLLDGWRKVFAPSGSRKKSVGKTLAFSLLLLYAFGVMIAGVTWFCLQMSVFVEMGLGWLYFSLAFLAGAAMTLIGNVYATQNQLYNARDNELLLAMPVKMEQICLSRMVFLLLGSAGYMLMITLPALVVYWVRFGMTLPVFFGYLVMFVCTVLLCQAVSCVLGWLLHLLLSKIRSKALGSLLFMTVFMVVYFWVYAKIMTRFEDILGQMMALGGELAALFADLGGFFVWLGQGVMGSLSALLIIVGITIPVVILGYLFMITTYRSSLLIRKSSEKAVRIQKTTGIHSPAMAICLKECRRFFTCSIYLMNMGLGIVLTALLGIAGVVFRSQVTEYLAATGLPMDVFLPLGFLFSLGFLQSMNAVSAPAISLEGKSLWILGSLPVDGWTILSGKLLFHLLATVPVSVLTVLVLGIVYGISPAVLVCLVLYGAAVPTLSGILGLWFGMQFPRFDWMNEAYPCKQSLAVLFTMLVMMGVTFLSGGLYLLILQLTGGLFASTAVIPGTFLAVLPVSVLTGVLYFLLKKYGGRKMEELCQQ